MSAPERPARPRVRLNLEGLITGDWLFVDEVAELMNVPNKTVRRLLKDDDAPFRAVKVENIWRVCAADVFRFIFGYED